MADSIPSRRTFIALALLFFVPILAAIALYYWFPQFQPSGKTNYGTLIDPARPLPPLESIDAQGHGQAAPLRGKWSYLYLGGATCEAACRDKLFQLRQIRTLLNEKRGRVQRVYLAPDAAAAAAVRTSLAADHPDLQVIALTPASAQTLRAFLEARDPQALYLVDPLGNWLMVYAGDADSRGILKDIQRLLRLSQIG